jgi:hypothetical protein
MSRGSKLLALAAATGLMAAAVSAQGPVSDAATLVWTIEWARQPDRTGGEADLVFSARIAPGWILYSSDFSTDIGPRPARFKFETDDSTAVVGPTRAVSALRHTGKAPGSRYTYFERQAQFRQTVRVATRPVTLRGSIDGQICHAVDGLCSLFHKPFSVSLD